ncbi:MAG TPA: ribonuclease HI family protein [Oligoflexia bacterium]|nr:ribonuclease HI family protein [Oligoflexia bacterium]HMR24855.1 ribonuclease HI family protein [Oligoflexia bacterium]
MNDKKKSSPICIAYIDGASRGNPGEASVGVSLCAKDGQELATVAKYIGQATNNVAEYTSLLEALDLAKAQMCKNVKIYADSQLMVRQIQGIYKVKNPELKKLWQQAMDKIQLFDSFEIEHVRREYNKRADELANIALDSKF